MVEENNYAYILLFNAVHRMSHGLEMKPEDITIINFRFPEADMHVLSHKEVWELFDTGQISRRDFVKYIKGL